jgi:hypothetical protein
VHEKFAAPYAAGCLAIKFGILPWQRERLLQALLSCTCGQAALVVHDRADAVRRQAAPLDLPRRHVRDNLGEFIDLRQRRVEDTSGHDHHACPGYLREHKDHGLEYLFAERQFERIVAGAPVARRLKGEPAGRSLINTAPGVSGDRCSVKPTIGKRADGTLDRQQVVAVRAAALDQARSPTGDSGMASGAAPATNMTGRDVGRAGPAAPAGLLHSPGRTEAANFCLSGLRRAGDRRPDLSGRAGANLSLRRPASVAAHPRRSGWRAAG